MKYKGPEWLAGHVSNFAEMGNLCGKTRPRAQRQEQRHGNPLARVPATAPTNPDSQELNAQEVNTQETHAQETHAQETKAQETHAQETPMPTSRKTDLKPFALGGARGGVRFQDVQRDRLRSSKGDGFPHRGSSYRGDDIGASAAIVSAMQLSAAAYSTDSCVSNSSPSCNTTCDSGVSCSSDAGASSSCNM